MKTDHLRSAVFKWACLALSFLVPAILAANFALNHFYVSGGVVFDSGWFTYLSTHATSWPLPNPSLIGGTYFSTHMSLIFYVYSAIYEMLAWAGFTLPAPVFFSLTQSFWFGLLSLAAYGLLLPPQKIRKNKHLGLALILALLVMLNGVSLSMMIFPHFEIAIPTLVLTFFSLWTNHYKKLSIIPLALGLLTREDAGLHYFGIFILLALALHFFSKNTEMRQHAKYFLCLASICLAYAVTTIGLQKHFYHLQTLSGVYLGNPPFHHITQAFIHEKIHFLLSHRTYIYIPLIICFIFAFLRRNIFSALGALFVLPWITLAFFAFSSDAGRLVFYYAFPVLIALLWPAVAYGFEKKMGSDKHHYLSHWWQASAIVAISFLLFWIFPRDISHQYLKNSSNFQWVKTWKNNQETLDALFESGTLGKNFVVDNAVGAIEMNSFTSKNFYTKIQHISLEELKKIDVLIFSLMLFTKVISQNKSYYWLI